VTDTAVCGGETRLTGRYWPAASSDTDICVQQWQNPFWGLAALKRRLHSSLSPILLFPGRVMHSSGRRPSILFLLFQLILSCAISHCALFIAPFIVHSYGVSRRPCHFSNFNVVRETINFAVSCRAPVSFCCTGPHFVLSDVLSLVFASCLHFCNTILG